ncbi:MAG: DUF4367 domain-containing protein [Firmicutes bacterium]|nr:DUF4367 domain-containing protein [Bacillota bacterium]
MEKNKDYEKRLGIRLREAYMKDYKGPAMSREEFHRLVEAAEKKKKHRRTLIGIVATCVTLCLVCGGFMAGVSMRESASAGKNDETKTVRQGGSVVIGSGVSEDDQNVGVSTKTYTDIEDIPEDLREQIHFLDSDEFELDRVKVIETKQTIYFGLYYNDRAKRKIEISEQKKDEKQNQTTLLPKHEGEYNVDGVNVYIVKADKGNMYSFEYESIIFHIFLEKGSEIKIEALVKGLIKH